MKIIVFGANGKTGLSFVRYALDKGHEVTAFVRNVEKITIEDKNLNIVQGSPLEKDTLKEKIKDHDIVVSCLGGNGNKKSTTLHDMVRNIVDVMNEENVKRIVHISSAGIHNEMPGFISKIFSELLYKNAINDHKLAAEYIINSGLVYTIARPLSLTEGKYTGNYRMISKGVPKGGTNISRADLAHFLLQAVENEEYTNKSICIAY